MAFLAFEILVVTGLFFVAFRLGLVAVVALVSSMQFLQAILGASLYWQVGGELLVSPGSSVLFAANIAALLYVYASRGAEHARAIFYAIVGSNIAMIVLSSVIWAHMNYADPVNFLGVPAKMFQVGLTSAAVGIAVLTLTQLVALTVYNRLADRFRRAPVFALMSVSLIVALSFDTVGYLVPLFWGDPNLPAMLESGLFSKGAAGITFGVLWGATMRRPRSERTESLQRLFNALTWSDENGVDGSLESGTHWGSFFALTAVAKSDGIEQWFEHLPYGVCIISGETIRLTNRVFADYVRAESAEALEGSRVAEILSERSIERMCSDDASSEKHFVHHLESLDGVRLKVESACFDLVLDDKPCRVLISRDVSEEEALRKQIVHADRLASVGTLAAGVAHEVNNPLAYILANQEYVLDALVAMRGSGSAADPAELDALIEALVDAKSGAEQVREIVAEMKNFSRAEKAPSEAIDVAALLESTLKLARIQFKHCAEIVTRYEPAPPVWAVRSRLAQVFMNLLVNAGQAIDEDSEGDDEIRLEVFASGDNVVIEVSDTGRGIPEAIRDRIMTPFFTTKSVGEGTGLGLATSNGIVTSMGGTMGFVSEVGRGTTFRVELPASKSRVDESEAPEVVTFSCDGARALVIDDETLLARSFERMLDETSVTVCHCGAEALAVLEGSSDFDIVFCDMKMPRMSGREIYETVLRENRELADRFVFMTGSLADTEIDEFFSGIENPALAKPLDWNEIRRLARDYASARQRRLPARRVGASHCSSSASSAS